MKITNIEAKMKVAGSVAEVRYIKQKLSKYIPDKYRWRYECQKHEAKLNARHWHLAECLIRGKMYKDVEAKVREGNSPSADLIKKKIKRVGSYGCDVTVEGVKSWLNGEAYDFRH